MGIYAVWGPPQSGKTSLAIDLAFALSLKGKSVCLISPELYSELAARLNIRIEPEKSLLAAYKKKDSLKQIVHTADDLLYVLAVPFDNDAFGEDMPEDAARTLVEQAGKMFDVVIVDCPSHTGSVLAAWTLSCADGVFMMSGSHSASVMWNHSFQRAISAIKKKTTYVCAEVNGNFDYRTLHTMLGICLSRGDGSEEEFRYKLTAEEQEMFRGKMEAYCSHDGMTLDEYREQYLEEADQAPSQTMQM